MTKRQRLLFIAVFLLPTFALFSQAFFAGVPIPVGGGGTTNLTTNLIAYWTMDENIASGTRNDSTANAENLTDVHANTPSSTTAILTRALAFDGTDKLMNHADDSNLSMGAGAQSFSISMWVRIGAFASPHAFIDKGAFDTHDEYLIYEPDSTHIRFSVGNGSTGVNLTSTFTPTVNAYFHILAVHDGVAQKLHLYVNGTEDGSSPVTYTGGTWHSTAAMAIGGGSADNAGSFLNGFVDEVGLWKRALGAGAATALYNGGAGLAFSSFPSTLQ